MIILGYRVLYGCCKFEDGNCRKINFFMKGSKYVFSIQVVCMKGMDIRVLVLSLKVVVFDFVEVDIVLGVCFCQVQLVYIIFFLYCSFSLLYFSFCNQYISFCLLI